VYDEYHSQDTYQQLLGRLDGGGEMLSCDNHDDNDYEVFMMMMTIMIEMIIIISISIIIMIIIIIM